MLQPIRQLARGRGGAARLLLALAASPVFAEPPAPPRAVMDAGTPTPPDSLSPEKSCAQGLLVQVRPRELKKRVRAAASGAELKALLKPVGMRTDRWLDRQCTQLSVTLDVFQARLVSADAQDFVLQVRGDACGNILDGVLLHPLEGRDAFCAIPMPFLMEQEGLPATGTTFGFENLTEPVFQVVRVHDFFLGTGFSHDELSYWEVQEGELRSIFSVDWIGDRSARSWVQGDAIARGAGFPRELHIREEKHSCDPSPDEAVEASALTNTCHVSRTEEVWQYRSTSPGRPGLYELRPREPR